MDTNNFQWTDELVKEFAADADLQATTEDVEKFKQSKVKKEEPKQWEILKCWHGSRMDTVHDYIDGKGTNPGKCCLIKPDPCDIYSVKRLSDNTTWTVGQKGLHGEIASIKLVEGNMIFEIKNNVYPYDYPLFIHELKSKPEEPLPIKVEYMDENSLVGYYRTKYYKLKDELLEAQEKWYNIGKGVAAQNSPDYKTYVQSIENRSLNK